MNAYCATYFGFINRIVFISTIIDKYHPGYIGLNTNELEGIFAHEVGHWMHNHNEKQLLIITILFEPIFFCLAMWLKSHNVVYEAFHFVEKDSQDSACDTYPLVPGLFIAQFILLRWLMQVI
jgi:Zn-dependent protease with chaperone function